MKKLHAKPCVNKRALKMRGIVLIDALIAILIFSIGILGLVALQGSAIQMTGAANYRINAALLADQVIAQMWATDPTQLAGLYQGKDGKGGDNYMTWLTQADCSSQLRRGCLPGVIDHPPVITVTPQTLPDSSNTQYQVTVTVNWLAPGDSSVHSYASTTAIGL